MIASIAENFRQRHYAFVQVAFVARLATCWCLALLDALWVGSDRCRQPFDEGPKTGDVVIGTGENLRDS